MVKYHRFDQTFSLCWMHQKSDESPRPHCPQYHAVAAISRNIMLSSEYRAISDSRRNTVRYCCLSQQYRATSAISFSRRNILIYYDLAATSHVVAPSRRRDTAAAPPPPPTYLPSLPPSLSLPPSPSLPLPPSVSLFLSLPPSFPPSCMWRRRRRMSWGMTKATMSISSWFDQ